MASGIYLNESILSSALRWSGTVKCKTQGQWTYVGRNAAGSCCHLDEEEDEQQRVGEVLLLKIFFSALFNFLA